MSTTAEKFADLRNGLVEINSIRSRDITSFPLIEAVEGKITPAIAMVMSRYMLGAHPLEGGSRGFLFVDGSTVFRREGDGRWETVRPVDLQNS